MFRMILGLGISPSRRIVAFVALLAISFLNSCPAWADSQANQGEAFETCKYYELHTEHVTNSCQLATGRNAYWYSNNWGWGNVFFFYDFATFCSSQPTVSYAIEFGQQTTCEGGCKYQATGTTTINGQLSTLLSPTNSEICTFIQSPTPVQDEDAGKSCNDCGNPINTGTGNKFQVEVDLPGSALLSFTRYYNSAGSAAPKALGQHWTHTYTRAVWHESGNNAFVLRPDGRVTKFVFANGVWTSAAWKRASLQRITTASNWTIAWRLEATDSREIEIYDRQGRLTSIERADGSKIWLTYNNGIATGDADEYLLSSVQAQDGRRLQFFYNAARRLTQLVDAAGQSTTYVYDTADRLSSVIYPGATSKTYLYNEASNTAGTNLPDALTGIIDERGVRFATFKYQADGKAISTEHAGGVEKVQVAYGQGGNTVTLPSGQTQTRTFASPVGVTMPSTLSSSAGGTTRNYSYTYDGNGFLDVATDPLLTTTDYDFDASGRPTQVIESANVAATKRTIQTDWHPTIDVPYERRLLDASGALESKAPGPTTRAGNR